jgi:hypothetical protein
MLIQPYTRRSFLRNASLAAASLPAAGLLLDSTLLQGQTTEISPTLIASVKESMQNLAYKVATKTAAASDYAAGQAQVTSLYNAMVSTNFDATFKANVAAVSGSIVLTAASISSLVYASTSQYAPSFTYAQTQAVFGSLPEFNPSLPASVRQAMVTSMLGTLASHGAATYVQQAVAALSDPTLGAVGLATCGDVNLLLWFFGGVLTVLGFGCLPLTDPLFAVICPALTAITLIIGVLTIIAGIICGL